MATPIIVPSDVPTSVRTYSVFDPNSNTWIRMTNGGRSPIPVPAPSRSSRKRSPASIPAGQPQSTPQKASKRGFDISPLGETESEKLKLAPRPVDRFRATVSPDYQEPVYPVSTPIAPATPTETAQEYGFKKLALINPMLAYTAGLLKSLPKVAPAIFWNPDSYTDHSDPRW